MPWRDGRPEHFSLADEFQKVGYEQEQPAQITQSVISCGEVSTRFGGTGVWSINTGAPTLTENYEGWDGSGVKDGVTSRTGQPHMLKVVPAANTTEEIILNSVGTNLLQNAWNGVLGLWVYVDQMNGYEPAGSVVGSIDMTISTAGTSANALFVSWNTNQVREGWNFLTFRMRNPSAYQSASGQTEYHPFGISSAGYGTGADSDIVNNTIGLVKVSWSNFLGSTLYFDSLWTGFSSKAQIIVGCDGGEGLMEYGLPVFNDYDWVSYLAGAYNAVDSGTANLTYQSDLADKVMTDFDTLYNAGWDIINHTITHPSLGLYTSEANIEWQIRGAQAWLLSNGYVQGSEFYASPQTSSSRLSDTVIKQAGIKLQRHFRKSNTCITMFGIDNPEHIGSLNFGSASQSSLSYCASGANGSVTGMQIASKITPIVDVAIAYGEAINMYWHGITITGDNGLGEDLTGDNLLITKSAFEISMAYIRTQELAGNLEVCKGFTGWYYGKG